MTGLSLRLFDELNQAIEVKFIAAEIKRLSRPARQRARGGRAQAIEMLDQLLMTVVWLRCYPKQHVLAYLFGVSESSVSRILNRMLPLLEQSGRDTMRTRSGSQAPLRVGRVAQRNPRTGGDH